MKHILLEVYCTKEHPTNQDQVTSSSCNNMVDAPNYNCLFHNCPYVAYTFHENALCYTNENAEACDIISLGGEMLPSNIDKSIAQKLWQQIASQKISEAYHEYMKRMKTIKMEG